MKKTPRILVVEDEEHLRDSIVLNLQMEGYNVRSAATGPGALDVIHGGRFDLLILDVMLPGMDGFTLCEKIRVENRAVPVLFLTAKDTAADRVRGLKTGGDDYLTKPFNLEEFILRVRNLIRRHEAEDFRAGEMEIFTFGKNSVNFRAFRALARGKTIPLTKREAMLLRLLIRHKGQAVPREKILETVWGYDAFPATRTVDNFILAFRKYFEKDPSAPEHFISVRGVGYMFCE